MVFRVAFANDCDLQGRKINFTNSKTLVGRRQTWTHRASLLVLVTFTHSETSLVCLKAVGSLGALDSFYHDLLFDSAPLKYRIVQLLHIIRTKPPLTCSSPC